MISMVAGTGFGSSDREKLHVEGVCVHFGKLLIER